MKKLLAETNPYLRDPMKRATLIRRSTTSSTAIEGVHIKHYKATLRKLGRKSSAKS